MGLSSFRQEMITRKLKKEMMRRMRFFKAGN
jgi:hypothetical protein